MANYLKGADANDVFTWYFDNHIGLGFDKQRQETNQSLHGFLYTPYDAYLDGLIDNKSGCESLPRELTRQMVLGAGARVVTHLGKPCESDNALYESIFRMEPEDNISTGTCTTSATGTRPSTYSNTDYLEMLSETHDANKVDNYVKCGGTGDSLDYISTAPKGSSTSITRFNNIANKLSWAWESVPGSIDIGKCAYVEAGSNDKDFTVSTCTADYKYACIDGAGDWQKTASAGDWDQGFTTCDSEFKGSVFAAPESAYQMTTLKNKAGTEALWVNHKSENGTWSSYATEQSYEAEDRKNTFTASVPSSSNCVWYSSGRVVTLDTVNEAVTFNNIKVSDTQNYTIDIYYSLSGGTGNTASVDMSVNGGAATSHTLSGTGTSTSHCPSSYTDINRDAVQVSSINLSESSLNTIKLTLKSSDTLFLDRIVIR